MSYKGELYSNELIKYTYSKKGRLIKQTNRRTEYKYTVDEKPSTRTKRTEITYKYKKGRLAEKTEITDNIIFGGKDGTKFLYSYNKKGRLYKVKQYSFRIKNNKIRHKELAVVERYYYYKNGQLKKYTSEDKDLERYIYRKVIDDCQYSTYQYDSMGNITQSEVKWTGNDYTYLGITNTKYKNTYKNGVLVKRRCNYHDYYWKLIKMKKKENGRHICDEYYNKNGDVYKTVWYQKDYKGKLVKYRVDKTSYKYYKGKYIKKKYVNGELTEEYSGYKKFKK